MPLTVVKVGGSLSRNPQALKDLCVKLSELAKVHQLVVVPGGAEFADCVRELDKRFSLSAATAHRMAILGMDQYGMLLADLTPNSQIVNGLSEARSVMVGRVAVFLPSRFMFEDGGLKSSWDVTSDSISVYIASKLSAEKVLLVKDVDGVFTEDPKKSVNAKLLKNMTRQQMSKLANNTGVDAYLPKLLKELKLKCYILNGQQPERIEAILNGKDAVCTIIFG
jgi:aspartokinase-like uncharacterized kinase